MASKISNLFGKFLMATLIFLMIAGVAVWGIHDILSGSRYKKVASVGNENIMDYELEGAINQKKYQLAQSGMNTLSDEFKMIIKNNVLVNFIGDRLLKNEFENLNMQLDAKEILKTDYLSQATLTKENIANMIRAQGGEKNFLDKIVKEKKIDLLQGSITSITPILQNTIDNVYGFENQTRDIEYLELGIDIIKDAPQPTATDLQDFYDKRKNEFLTPEYRSFSYIVLDKSLVKNPADDNDLMQKLHDTANEILDKVAGGSSFEEVAKEYGLKIEQVKAVDNKLTTKEGTKFSGKLPDIKNFVEAVFATSDNQISDLLESDDGKKYALVKIDGVEEKRIKTLDEVKSAVADGWKTGAKAKKLLELAEALQKGLNDGKTTLKDFADKNHLQIKTKEGIKLKPEFISPDFTAEIFHTEKNKYTKLQTGLNNTLILAKIDKINIAAKPSDAAMFTYKSKVQEQVSQEIMTQYLDYLKGKYKVRIYPN